MTELADGRYVVVWEDRSGSGVWENGTDLKAQIFNADGTKYGGEISVNSTVYGNQQEASVAALAGGGFVVTWKDYQTIGWSSGNDFIKAQIFGDDGSKVGGEFTVSSSGRQSQGWAQAVGLADGSFVIGWIAVGDSYAINSYDSFAQHFAATGARLGGEFRINTTQSGFQGLTQLVARDDGGFIATWRDESRQADDPSDMAVRAQIFDSSATKVGAEFLVNTTTQNSQIALDVENLDSGGFISVFRSVNADGSESMKAQMFDDAGNRTGGEFDLVFSLPEVARFERAFALTTGGFIVIWSEGEMVPETYEDYDWLEDRYVTRTREVYYPRTLHGQALDADGSEVGDPFQIDQTAGGQDQYPDFVQLSDGSFVIVWQTEQGRGYGDYAGEPNSEVLMQRFKFAGVTRDGTDAPDIIGGTNLDDVLNGFGAYDFLYGFGGDDLLDGGDDYDALYGGPGNDTLIGGQGDDNLDGGTGADIMSGGTDNDTYWVDDAGDQVVEEPGEGTDTVYSSVGFTLPANVENLILLPGAASGTGNLLANIIVADPRTGATLSGGGGDDLVTASKQSDTVHGGEGNDTIYGLSGFDTIYGDGGNDTIVGGGNADTIHGGEGNDDISGGNGLDWLYGEGGRDFLKGGIGVDYLDGGADDDELRGNDGRDTLIGGSGMDLLTGGRGADLFVFRDGDFAGLDGASADRIFDFSRGQSDLIDLSAVDAVEGGEDDAFTFIGNAAFSGTAGELRYEFIDGYTMVTMDVDGDMIADFAIRVDGTLNLLASDFVL